MDEDFMAGEESLEHRVFRLEDQNRNIIDRIQAHSDEARASTARIHTRIDHVDSDIAALREVQASNSATLKQISSSVEPIADIVKSLVHIRHFLIFIATPLGAIAILYEAFQFLRSL